MHRRAFFISPHGYGHAARSAAIMQALLRAEPAARFEIFTTVPAWFFEESLGGAFRHHPLVTDVGLAQRSALSEDIPETVRRLDAFYPVDPDLLAALAASVLDLGCEAVVCDIAPMGISVARAAGLPAVLVENFTWDWIYGAYQDARLAAHAAALGELFALADLHIQTDPCCRPVPGAPRVPPISRRLREPRERVRERLGVGASKLVLISMGGVPEPLAFLDRLAAFGGVSFLVPGGPVAPAPDNVRYLPSPSGFFHPDLVNASDAVVGKIGYSTLAEVYHAGVPYAYITRQRFPESPVLAAFVEERMRGLRLDEDAFTSGDWLARLPELLSTPRVDRSCEDGARLAADLVARV